ncbi:MAG TPA: hypothetical protein VKB59_08790 [Micromonosporaceae bacterium]|nr:hypothetical protein [Micromonosporaceae bacterium]
MSLVAFATYRANEGPIGGTAINRPTADPPTDVQAAHGADVLDATAHPTAAADPTADPVPPSAETRAWTGRVVPDLVVRWADPGVANRDAANRDLAPDGRHRRGMAVDVVIGRANAGSTAAQSDAYRWRRAGAHRAGAPRVGRTRGQSPGPDEEATDTVDDLARRRTISGRRLRGIGRTAL